MNVRADRAALKRAARDNMAGARPRPWKVTMLYLLLTTGVTLLVVTLLGNPFVDLMNAASAAISAGYDYEDVMGMVGMASQRQSAQGLLTLFMQTLLRLYAMVMAFGYVAYSLRRTRGGENGSRDLLCGFGMVGRVIWLRVLVFIYSLGWSFMVMFPAMGVLFALALPAAYLITSDAGIVLLGVLTYLVAIVAALVVYYLTQRYEMAPYLLLDHPEWTAREAVRRSREMLRGRVGEIFRLKLSFLGWNLLQAVVVLGPVLLVEYLLDMAGVIPAAAEWLTTAVSLLAVLPVGLWLYPYFYGTLSEYYGFLSNRAHSGPELRVEPADDDRGPESF